MLLDKFCRSLISPNSESIKELIFAALKSDSVVSGGNEKPFTTEPMDESQRDSQPPLKPVWPVRKTFFPFQKEGSTLEFNPAIPSRVLYFLPIIFRASSYPLRCPLVSKNLRACKTSIGHPLQDSLMGLAPRLFHPLLFGL